MPENTVRPGLQACLIIGCVTAISAGQAKNPGITKTVVLNKSFPSKTMEIDGHRADLPSYEQSGPGRDMSINWLLS
jgi:hypothetical protein